MQKYQKYHVAARSYIIALAVNEYLHKNIHCNDKEMSVLL